MNWMDSLAMILTDVSNNNSGQAGKVVVTAPDKRVPVMLTAVSGSIILDGCGGLHQTFTPDQAAQAVSAYCAAVEGYA